jgi:hypothetical protein
MGRRIVLAPNAEGRLIEVQSVAGPRAPIN